jgi:hypothetical protein
MTQSGVTQRGAMTESRPEPEPAHEPMTELVRRISDDLTTIAKDVVALGRIEITHDLRATLADVGGIVLGGVVVLIALGLLCSGVVVALAPLVASLAARMFIMSGVYAVLGLVVAGIYIKRMKGDSSGIGTPRARREVSDTADAIREQMHHG